MTNEIPSKTKGKIWIGSKEVQQRTGIESAIVYEELLGKLVEYSYRMFTYNWGYFYLNNKIVEASKAETLQENIKILKEIAVYASENKMHWNR